MNIQCSCIAHVQVLCSCESSALNVWTHMMTRGIPAYASCRFDEARSFLRSAMEVGLIRRKSRRNSVFESLHITKPASFLTEIMIAEEKFDEVEHLLNNISSAMSSDSSEDNFALSEFIDAMRVRSEGIEREYALRTPLAFDLDKPGGIRPNHVHYH